MNKDLACDLQLFHWRINMFEEEASPYYPPTPFLLPDRNPLSWAPFPRNGAVSPETSRIFHLWLKWTSYVWDPWLWVKSPNCLLTLPKPTIALKYCDIPQVLGSVRTSVGLSHSVPRSTLQTLTSLLTTLVLWTWESVHSSSIHNSAQDFFLDIPLPVFQFNFNFTQDSGLLCLSGNASHPQQVEKHASVKDKKLF